MTRLVSEFLDACSISHRFTTAAKAHVLGESSINNLSKLLNSEQSSLLFSEKTSKELLSSTVYEIFDSLIYCVLDASSAESLLAQSIDIIAKYVKRSTTSTSHAFQLEINVEEIASTYAHSLLEYLLAFDFPISSDLRLDTINSVYLFCKCVNNRLANIGNALDATQKSGLLRLSDYKQLRLVDLLGDPHNGFQSVVSISFGHHKWYYKPRSSSPERLWDKLLKEMEIDWISELRQIIDVGSAFLDKSVDSSNPPIDPKNYFYRFGKLLAAAHVSRSTDLWFDNLIATEKGPVFIDNELILQPFSAEFVGSFNSSSSFNNNVYSTMMLSFPMVMQTDRRFQDIGCLNRYKTYFWPGEEFSERSEGSWSPPIYLPRDTESYSIPTQYQSEIIAGYLDAAETIVHKKDKLASILNSYKGTTRVIRRSTFLYYKYLRSSQAKVINKSGLSRWNYIVDILPSPSQASDEIEWDRELSLLSEVYQLDQGDIPVFRSSPHEQVIKDCNESIVGRVSFNHSSRIPLFQSSDFIEQQVESIKHCSSIVDTIDKGFCIAGLNKSNKSVKPFSLKSILAEIASKARSRLTECADKPCISLDTRGNCIYYAPPSLSFITGLPSLLEALLTIGVICLDSELIEQAATAISTMPDTIHETETMSSGKTFYSALFDKVFSYNKNIARLKRRVNMIAFSSGQLSRTAEESILHDLPSVAYLKEIASYNLSIPTDSNHTSFRNLMYTILLAERKDSRCFLPRQSAFQSALLLLNGEELDNGVFTDEIDLLIAARDGFNSGWIGWVNFLVFIDAFSYLYRRKHKSKSIRAI